MGNDLKDVLVKIRRAIHMNPELGTKEFKTASLVEKVLKQYKIKTKRYAKTGVVGVLEGFKKGKCIALRGDMDALPITEINSKPYCSLNKGIMHACGHDANTTMVLGAAMLLAGEKSRLAGTVKFIFQPNEEMSGGAQSMVNAGALNSPKVDAIVGIHVSPWLKTGVLGLKKGAMMAAVDKFEIEIIGDGGHGAYPHLGKDSIVIAGQVISALQTIISREINPVAPAVITIGKIEGGERFNVLCGKVKMTGTVRSLNDTVRRKIKQEIERKVKHITAAYGAGFKIKYEGLGSALVNDDRILQLCLETGQIVLGRQNAVMLEEPSMGGEDFAEYLKKAPGCFVYIGSSNGSSYPWHHEKFDIDENVLPAGAVLLSEIAKKYLN